ncbi:uncharacterized protein LOC131674052 isoform X2 [Phymastichus coffea]|nr:uncharacterized protein LOC131674052 isoform X2 [Phymastichus coffea]XP_058808498.1 uncharacterized protein LOC131674052 isoform X2 [Phymastichus coffea]XP_058808499.1 uncharacterized protein LOC131674052 isoform X2 [Phymastichus coffea]
MECSRSSPKYVCSICGSETTIKIEEKVEESTTTTFEIVEDATGWLRFDDNSLRRVPFPEAGVDIVDRKLKNTEDSLWREIDEHRWDDGDILTYTESWTENWLFRRKKESSAREDTAGVSFKPVSMFVPSTSAKCRAMIGDQDVDEISDLSDLSDLSDGSDGSDDSDGMARREADSATAKYIYDQRSRVFIDGRSKHHGENLGLAAGRPDQPTANGQASSPDDDRPAGREGLADHEPADNRSRYRSELFVEARHAARSCTMGGGDDGVPCSAADSRLTSPPRPGTIADREHRKWQTAAPMENNPYSEENLQRRLAERSRAPRYSSGSSLFGMARTNGLDNARAVVADGIQFETMDLPPEKSSARCDNDAPVTTAESRSAAAGQSIVIDCENTDTAMVTRPKEDQIPRCRQPPLAGRPSPRGSGGNDVARAAEDAAKNTSGKSKRSDGHAIQVTRNDATINEADCAGSGGRARDQAISLPSVKKLVEVFSQKQRAATGAAPVAATATKPKDRSDGDSQQQQQQPKLKRVERTAQQSAPPLHLHSLTARSLSKEFREGLR